MKRLIAELNDLLAQKLALGGRHAAHGLAVCVGARHEVDHETLLDGAALGGRHVEPHLASFILGHVAPLKEPLFVREQRPEARTLLGVHLIPEQNFGRTATNRLRLDRQQRHFGRSRACTSGQTGRKNEFSEQRMHRERLPPGFTRYVLYRHCR